MLLKTKISKHQLSLDPALNEDYYRAKLGRFTSSEFHYLMAEKGLGSAGLNYIYRKVGEAMSGRQSRDGVSTSATEHGLNYEREGLIKFGQKMGLESLLVQRLILDEDGYCGGTPDGLIVMNESTDGLYYNVQTVEIKAPYSFDGYIRAWKCKTPEDLKREFREWYYQKLHQMYLADCLVGYFVIYMPFFKAGQMNIIEFRKIHLMPEFKLITERTKQAIGIFKSTINELKHDN